MIEKHGGDYKNIQFCWYWSKFDWDIDVLELTPFFETPCTKFQMYDKIRYFSLCFCQAQPQLSSISTQTKAEVRQRQHQIYFKTTLRFLQNMYKSTLVK